MTPDTSTRCKELNAFLRINGVPGTGGKVKIVIRSGAVKVNGEIETKNKRKLHAGDFVEYIGKSYVASENLIIWSKLIKF